MFDIRVSTFDEFCDMQVNEGFFKDLIFGKKEEKKEPTYEDIDTSYQESEVYRKIIKIYEDEYVMSFATDTPDMILIRVAPMKNTTDYTRDILYVQYDKKKCSIDVWISDSGFTYKNVPQCDNLGNGLPKFIFSRNLLVDLFKFIKKFTKSCIYKDYVDFFKAIVDFCCK